MDLDKAAPRYVGGLLRVVSMSGRDSLSGEIVSVALSDEPDARILTVTLRKCTHYDEQHGKHKVKPTAYVVDLANCTVFDAGDGITFIGSEITSDFAILFPPGMGIRNLAR